MRYMKNIIQLILFLTLFGCGGAYSEAIIDSAATNIDISTSQSNSTTTEAIDLKHKYTYVVRNDDGSMVIGMLDIYSTNEFTQTASVVGSKFMESGRGSYVVNGDKLILNRTGGIAINGTLSISKGDENKLWLSLDNGVTYVEDDNLSYIKNLQVTPFKKSEISHNNETTKSETPIEIKYEGTMTDNQSGISQEYTLYIKPDFSSASIGGGPYNRIEDQRDGSYMWLDGTIIGMSFKPMSDRCIVYGSDGNYFCTLYSKNIK